MSEKASDFPSPTRKSFMQTSASMLIALNPLDFEPSNSSKNKQTDEKDRAITPASARKTLLRSSTSFFGVVYNDSEDEAENGPKGEKLMDPDAPMVSVRLSTKLVPLVDREGSPNGSPRRPGSAKSPQNKKKKNIFEEGDFENRNADRDSQAAAERRKRAAAKARGLKLDPSDWTRADLLNAISKFAKFTQDKKSGVAELVGQRGSRIKLEDITILCELFRRVNEVQTVQLNYCNLSDEHVTKLLIGFKNLRHLKRLELSGNSLTGVSVDAVIDAYSNASRQLEHLSLSNNQELSFDDGLRLFESFITIISLNDIPVKALRLDTTATVLNLSSLNIRAAELGIAVAMIRTVFTQLFSVNLRDNNINSRSLEILVKNLKRIKNIRELDLSNNPITNGGKDFSGIHKMHRHIQRKSQLLKVTYDSADIPPLIKESIDRGLSVNRSSEGTKYDGSRFSKFLAATIVAAGPSEKKYEDLANWNPKADGCDELFIRNNHLPLPKVSVADSGFTITWESTLGLDKSVYA